jgi:hypothetical protein
MPAIEKLVIQDKTEARQGEPGQSGNTPVAPIHPMVETAGAIVNGIRLP